MTTGYHRPRTAPRPAGTAKQAHPNAALNNTVIDLSETDVADMFELPGGELPPDELAMEILAEQADEFTCVRHRSQLAREKGAIKYCRDCE